jgi:hypothetical protein
MDSGIKKILKKAKDNYKKEVNKTKKNIKKIDKFIKNKKDLKKCENFCKKDYLVKNEICLKKSLLKIFHIYLLQN